MYGVMLIIVLIITGGAIAYIGDHLGTKVGKKRLSIFGLRPKHTSILVTIITGICITTLTLGVMAAASENVRTALFGMEKLNREMDAARLQLADASAELAKSKAEQQAADAALDKAKNDLVKLENNNRQLSRRAKELQDGNLQLEKANEELTLRYEELLASQDELKRGNEKLLAENSELEVRNQELKDSIQIMREGDICFRAGEVLASARIKAGSSVSSVNETLAQMTKEAQEYAYQHLLQRVNSEIKPEDYQLWIFRPEFDEAAKTISERNSDVVVRMVAAGNMLRGEGIRMTIVIYDNHIVYHDNDEILSKSVFLSGSNGRESENALIAFLKDLNQTAVSKGMIADPLNGSVGVIAGEQLFAAIQSLEQLKGTALISAFANGDADVLGPLRLKIKISGAGN